MNRLIIVSRYLGDPLFGAAFAPREVVMVGDLIPEISDPIESASTNEYTKQPNITRYPVSSDVTLLKQGCRWNELLLQLMNQRTPSCIDECLSADIFEDIPAVGQRFVQALKELDLQISDEIYIYGLQLILLPKLMREAGIKNKLYLHIGHEMPADEIMRILPDIEQYLSSLLCSNVLCFQSEADLDEFKSIVGRFLGLVYSDGSFLASEHSNGYEVLCTVSPIGRNLQALLALDTDYFYAALGVPMQDRKEMHDSLENARSSPGEPKLPDNTKYVVAVDTTTDDPLSLCFRAVTIQHILEAGNRDISYVQVYSCVDTYGSPFPLLYPNTHKERSKKFAHALALVADINAKYGTATYVPIRLYWNMTADVWSYLKNAAVYWHAQSFGTFSLPMMYTMLLNNKAKYLVNEAGYTGNTMAKFATEQSDICRFFNLHDPFYTARDLEELANLPDPDLTENSPNMEILRGLISDINLDEHVKTVNSFYLSIQSYIKNQQKIPRLVDELTLFKYVRDNMLLKYKHVVVITSVNDTLTDIIMTLRKANAESDGINIYGESNNSLINQKILLQRRNNQGISSHDESLADNDGFWGNADQEKVVFFPILDIPLPSVISGFDKMKTEFYRAIRKASEDKSLANFVATPSIEQPHHSIASPSTELVAELHEELSDTPSGTSNELIQQFKSVNSAESLSITEMEASIVTATTDASMTGATGGDSGVSSVRRIAAFNPKCAMSCNTDECTCLDQRGHVDMIVCDNTSGGSQWYETNYIPIIIENGHAIKNIGERYFTNQSYFDNSILDPIRDLMGYYKDRTPRSHILESYTNITFYIEQYTNNNQISLNQLIGHLESGGLLKDERLTLSRNAQAVTVSIDKHMLKTSIESTLKSISERRRIPVNKIAIIALGNIPTDLFNDTDADNRPFVYSVSVSSVISMSQARLKNSSSAKRFLAYLTNFYREYKKPSNPNSIPNFGDKVVSLHGLSTTSTKSSDTELQTELISGPTRAAAAALVEEVLGKAAKTPH